MRFLHAVVINRAELEKANLFRSYNIRAGNLRC